MLGIQPLREDRRRVCSLLVWLSAGSVQFQCPNPMLAMFARIRHPNVQTVWTKQAIHDSLCLQMPKGHIKFVKYSRWQLEACLIQKCLPRFLTVSREPVQSKSWDFPLGQMGRSWPRALHSPAAHLHTSPFCGRQCLFATRTAGTQPPSADVANGAWLMTNPTQTCEYTI